MSQDNLAVANRELTGYPTRSSEVLKRYFPRHPRQEHYPADNQEDHESGKDINDTEMPGVFYPADKIYCQGTNPKN